MKAVLGHISRYAVLGGAAFILASCASVENNHDPYEGINRSVFSFNKAVDDVVVDPAIEVYRAVVPNPLRTGVRNLFFHVKSPLRFVNQLLQGDLGGAGHELFRTVVNTFVGAGGLIDVAAMEGYEAEKEDFGQTLGVWGVDHGPYVIVPFFGPSSLRDYVGYAVDGMADPLRLWAFNVEKSGRYYTKSEAAYFSMRDELKDVLDDLEASSIDYYAAVRSSYFQARDALVRDAHDSEQSAMVLPTIPEYDDADFDF